MSQEKGTQTVVTAAGGLGFGGTLAVAFIVLKLCGVIDWSWVWVLAPAWIPGSLVLLLLTAFTILFIGAGIVDARERRRQARQGQPAPNRHGPAHKWPR